MAKAQQQSQASPNLQPPRNRTLMQSWTAIPPRKRLLISLGVCVFGATGLMISDYMEKTALAVKVEKAAKAADAAGGSDY
ncbi:hypothetical protein GALMADRAFT_383011 [Galerina marginata CBS 339.88]|uniref:Cytochrome c oxidase assembly factor 3 n=1 Tax=Galerina marginata (strain CBS 339.88) TaxID=685588 RepID=A0A067U2U9_GALM3|nr:hypothetical protein GALMADRAFT_383011 [Galerina marginata CBS 339.88]